MSRHLTQFDWWGYLHVNGSIQVKRAWAPTLDEDMRDAALSNMVVRTAGPVKAARREQAIAILKEKLL